MLPPAAMRPIIVRGLLATAIVLAYAGVRPCEAVTGAWSPRLAAPTTATRPTRAHGFWTRARFIREAGAATEIMLARKHREDPPPHAATARTTLASRLSVGQQQERRSPSSAGGEHDSAYGASGIGAVAPELLGQDGDVGALAMAPAHERVA